MESIFMPLDLAGILDNLHYGLYVVDSSRRIIFWNKAAERITGFQRDEVIGKTCFNNILIHMDYEGKELCMRGCPLEFTIKDGTPREAEVFFHHKEGHRVPVSISVTQMKNDEGEIIGIELFSESNPQASLRTKIAELEKLALLDPLTRLPNRRQLTSQLVSQLAMWNRSNIPFGVLFFDIDHFKLFNDEHGHNVGDIALQTVAKSLSAFVRPFDTIGRWGGEEFLGIFINTSAELLSDIAKRLCTLVRMSRVETVAGPLGVTVSIGGTVPTIRDTYDSLLKRADTMMYISKESGRDQATIG
jgi:diguanylate cyclase (GGDEF)-like protein/PAS domain S-box-containing protein